MTRYTLTTAQQPGVALNHKHTNRAFEDLFVIPLFFFLVTNTQIEPSKVYSLFHYFFCTGMRFDGRALMVQFAKYGPNAEKM